MCVFACVRFVCVCELVRVCICVCVQACAECAARQSKVVPSNQEPQPGTRTLPNHTALRTHAAGNKYQAKQEGFKRKPLPIVECVCVRARVFVCVCISVCVCTWRILLSCTGCEPACCAVSTATGWSVCVVLCPAPSWPVRP